MFVYIQCVCVCVCVRVSMFTCDRVLQSAGLAARAWTLHAPFIPLTSDKAEALLVMMWLLLPIMPHCRPGRKNRVLFFPLSPTSCLWNPALCCSFMKPFSLQRYFKTASEGPRRKAWFHYIALSTAELWLLSLLSCPDCIVHILVAIKKKTFSTLPIGKMYFLTLVLVFWCIVCELFSWQKSFSHMFTL